MLIVAAGPSPAEHCWPHNDNRPFSSFKLIEEVASTRQLADGSSLTAQVGVLVGEINSLANERNLEHSRGRVRRPKSISMSMRQLREEPQGLLVDM